MRNCVARTIGLGARTMAHGRLVHMGLRVGVLVLGVWAVDALTGAHERGAECG